MGTESLEPRNLRNPETPETRSPKVSLPLTSYPRDATLWTRHPVSGGIPNQSSQHTSSASLASSDERNTVDTYNTYRLQFPLRKLQSTVGSIHSYISPIACRGNEEMRKRGNTLCAYRDRSWSGKVHICNSCISTPVTPSRRQTFTCGRKQFLGAEILCMHPAISLGDASRIIGTPQSHIPIYSTYIST
jgi:hypothetical protein